MRAGRCMVHGFSILSKLITTIFDSIRLSTSAFSLLYLTFLCGVRSHRSIFNNRSNDYLNLSLMFQYLLFIGCSTYIILNPINFNAIKTNA